MKDRKEIFENDAFSRKNPFRVPEGYFDSLESRLSVQDPEDTVSEGKRRFLVPSAVMALSFVFVLGIGTLLMKTFTPDGSDPVGRIPELSDIAEEVSMASLVINTSLFDYEYVSERMAEENLEPVDAEEKSRADEEDLMEFLSMNTSFVTADNGFDLEE